MKISKFLLNHALTISFLTKVYTVLLILGNLLVFTFLMSIPLKICWNFVMPSVFGVGTLSFGKAWAFIYLLGLVGTQFKSTIKVGEQKA